MYKVRIVENNNPPTTEIPIETRLSEPAPNAKAMGKIPKIAHKLVMIIGRKRAAEAALTLSLIPHLLVGKFDNQDTVFGDQPHQRNDADLAENI